jgi:5-methylcytosine-specific restriction enzyme A
MPYAPARPCIDQPCPNLVEHGARCSEHRRAFERGRGSASQRGYGSVWQRARQAFLLEHPICMAELGCDDLATDVDHIRPRRAGGPDSSDNLQALCGPHHRRKTALQSSGWGQR